MPDVDDIDDSGRESRTRKDGASAGRLETANLYGMNTENNLQIPQ